MPDHTNQKDTATMIKTRLTGTSWERRNSGGVVYDVVRDEDADSRQSNRSLLLRNTQTGRTFWATPEGLERKYVPTPPGPPLQVPDGLSDHGALAAQTINEFLTKHELTEFGGGSRFYTPQEWSDREESFGTESLLILTHDGGDAATVFSTSERSESLHRQMQDALSRNGMFAEACTHWFTAIYNI